MLFAFFYASSPLRQLTTRTSVTQFGLNWCFQRQCCLARFTTKGKAIRAALLLTETHAGQVFNGKTVFLLFFDERG